MYPLHLCLLWIFFVRILGYSLAVKDKRLQDPTRERYPKTHIRAPDETSGAPTNEKAGNHLS